MWCYYNILRTFLLPYFIFIFFIFSFLWEKDVEWNVIKTTFKSVHVYQRDRQTKRKGKFTKRASYNNLQLGNSPFTKEYTSPFQSLGIIANLKLIEEEVILFISLTIGSILHCEQDSLCSPYIASIESASTRSQKNFFKKLHTFYCSKFSSIFCRSLWPFRNVILYVFLQ